MQFDTLPLDPASHAILGVVNESSFFQSLRKARNIRRVSFSESLVGRSLFRLRLSILYMSDNVGFSARR